MDIENAGQTARRKVPVGYGLYFDYEVIPHPILANMAARLKGMISRVSASRPLPPTGQPLMQLTSIPPGTVDTVPTSGDVGEIDCYVPFKQTRLEGQTNPLRAPLQVETVLIGKALGQPSGYLSGVGFRIRDDATLEAEFSSGIRQFESYEQFENEVTIMQNNLLDVARTAHLEFRPL